MNTTLHSPTFGHDTSNGDGAGPESNDLIWAEGAFGSHDKTESRRTSRSALQRALRPNRRHLVMVLCVMVLIFVGLVASVDSLSPGTPTAPKHPTVTAGGPPGSASPLGGNRLDPLPLLERGVATRFGFTPLGSSWLLPPPPERSINTAHR